MSIGDKIKAKRKELKLSVLKLAVMLDIPADRIYKWEKGTTPSLYEDHQKINLFLDGKISKSDLESVSKVEDLIFSYEELVQMNRNNIAIIKELRQRLSPDFEESTVKKKANAG